jgi:hypothetical protein
MSGEAKFLEGGAYLVVVIPLSLALVRSFLPFFRYIWSGDRGELMQVMLPLPLSREIVCLLEPDDQLFINIVDGVHANAMGEQRIEAGSGFESLSRRHPLED